jgi:AAA domain
LAALRAKFGFKALPVALKKLGGKALDEGLTEKIIRWARKLAEATGKPCRSITMDTVAAALGGRKEDDEGLGRLRVLGERIHAETGATIVWVHHEGKSENMGPRGHTTLFDACSIWWHLEERESGDRVVHVAKAKRGPCYEPLFSFKLASFDAGKDNRGKSINLCAVELSDLDEALASKPRVRFGPRRRRTRRPGLAAARRSFCAPYAS